MGRIFAVLFFVAALSTNCFAREFSLPAIAHKSHLVMFSDRSFGCDGNIFLFAENSHTFTFNGISMPLGFPAVRRRGKLFINELDCRNSLFPLLPTVQLGHKNIVTIAVDAGHGGEDGGTVSSYSDRLREKVLTMDVCVRLAHLLSERGFKVVMTRKTDKKIPLAERSQIANEAGADLFISVHFNSAPSKLAQGIETFALTPVGQTSTYRPDLRNNPEEKLAGNRCDGLNTLLGYCVQSSLIGEMGAIDRGVKYGNFTVLKDLKCPAVLVECGFLSNQTESAQIATSEHRNKLAKSICLAVVKFSELVSKK
jgi:N-acetylmuramoyl-L-alanine amidase